MALEKGLKLGPYEIKSPIGAGGMGEVYMATDTRLDRTVAIKIMPVSLANKPDLKQRFDREAKAISSLNHPNICTLFDVGHENGTDYLVMEYIEGETLSDRLAKGPVPLEEMLRIATQIVDALDKAHGQGLIHRDLKPGNVMLTKEGAKLLDFGLAKLNMDEDMASPAFSITRSTPLTTEGSIIGTMQYMSPEQLEGKEADARSDIFAFGALLYEMATGKRAFEGTSQASLIAAVLEKEPAPISSVNHLSPPAFDRLVRKCLAKDPHSRWQSARDLADELRWIQQSGSQAGIPAKISKRRRYRMRTAWVVASAAALIAVFFAGLWFTRPTPEAKVRRYTIDPGNGSLSVEWPSISPDGKNLAFRATDSTGKSQIWIRPMNSLKAYPLAGTESAWRPFWSPDSKYLGFIVNRTQVKKISVAGGPAQLIGEVKGGADGSWGSSGTILFDGGVSDSIRQISASGGVATAATFINRENKESYHSWPSFLPDGRHFLFLAESNDQAASNGKPILMVGSLDSKETKTLIPVDSRVVYCEPGYIVYVLDEILIAQRFDLDNLEPVGEPVPIADQVGFNSIQLANFSVSSEGTLTYQTGIDLENSRLAWLDRKGNEIDSIGSPAPYGDIQLSPDGERLVYDIFDPAQKGTDIWVRDLKRNVSSRLTFDSKNEVWPIWSPDGSEIYYASDSDGRYNIMKKPANGTGIAEIVLKADSGNVGPSYFSNGGKTLYYCLGASDWNILRVDLYGKDSIPKVICGSPYLERTPCISPDGKYMAYISAESGRPEIYLLDLTGSGGKWQISTNTGLYPQWRKDGRELYYITTDWNFMAVSINTATDELQVGIPQKLFTRQPSRAGINQNRYAVSADGQRILINSVAATSQSSRFNVVLNWPGELTGH